MTTEPWEILEQHEGTIEMRRGINVDTGFPILEVTFPTNPIAFAPAELLVFINKLRDCVDMLMIEINPGFAKEIVPPSRHRRAKRRLQS